MNMLSNKCSPTRTLMHSQSGHPATTMVATGSPSCVHSGCLTCGLGHCRLRGKESLHGLSLKRHSTTLSALQAFSNPPTGDYVVKRFDYRISAAVVMTKISIETNLLRSIRACLNVRRSYANWKSAAGVPTAIERIA